MRNRNRASGRELLRILLSFAAEEWEELALDMQIEGQCLPALFGRAAGGVGKFVMPQRERNLGIA